MKSRVDLTAFIGLIGGAASIVAGVALPTDSPSWEKQALVIAGVIGQLCAFVLRTYFNQTPPVGTTSALIPRGQIPVTVDQDGVQGLSSAKALPGTVSNPTALTPAVPGKD